MKLFSYELKLHSTQILVIGFGVIILLGSLLLNLPVASVSGESIGFLDALFTATSAVCVTGLTVVDTGTYFSLFGQIVIMVLIQIGGLGFMTMATAVFMLVGKKITLRERLIIQEELNEFSLQGLVRLTRNILLVTLMIEGTGMALLATSFVPIYGFAKGLYFSLFHAVSAFCNAGFDLIGHGRSLTPFVDNVIVNLTVMGLVVFGGLGFTVILDIYQKRDFKKLTLHSKVVLIVTAVLIVFGFIFFLLAESSNIHTLGNPELTLPGKILGALFQSVTPRTAGFNTIDTAGLTNASKFMVIVFMFIGASPASTAGGIKTTTFSVIFLLVVTVVKGRNDVELFKRRLSRELVNRALVIAIVSQLLVTVVTLVLCVFEANNPRQDIFNFINVLFETTSAFGTVGLSAGVTSYLSDISKVLIILTMFAGRLGPLTLALAFAKRQSHSKRSIRYPVDRIMVG